MEDISAFVPMSVGTPVNKVVALKTLKRERAAEAAPAVAWKAVKSESPMAAPVTIPPREDQAAAGPSTGKSLRRIKVKKEGASGSC